MNKPEKTMADEKLEKINFMLEVCQRTALLSINMERDIARHGYYPIKDAYQADPDGEQTVSNEMAHWRAKIAFANAQISQNLAIMTQFQVYEMRQRLVELKLLTEAVPEIPSCSVGREFVDGWSFLNIGGSC